MASFDHGTIRWLHQRHVPFDLGITTFGYIIGIATYAKAVGASWCFPNFRYVEPAMVVALHEAGVRVVPWTVNRERDWQRLRELGCDGVITDLPGKAVLWRDS